MWCFSGLLGVAIIFLFFYQLMKEHKLSNALLGLFTIGVTLILLSIFQPSSIKHNGTEIQLWERVEKIERNLREYAILNHSGKINDTIKDSKLEFISLKPNEKGFGYKLIFSLSKKPTYIEVRGNQAQGVLSSHTENGLIIYTFKTESYWGPDQQIEGKNFINDLIFLIEVYYE